MERYCVPNTCLVSCPRRRGCLQSAPCPPRSRASFRPRPPMSDDLPSDFKGGSLHDGFGGFDGFGGSGKHLAVLLLVLQNTVPRGSRNSFDGFGSFGGCGGFGPDGYLA